METDTSLLSLPDTLLTYILSLLPSPRALLACCEASRLLAAAVTDECWAPHSDAHGWMVRRRQEDGRAESCEAHFRRIHASDATILLASGEFGDGDPTVSALVEAFSPREERWLEPPVTEKSAHAADFVRNAPCFAADCGVAYLIGGWDDDEEEALADVLCLCVPGAADGAPLRQLPPLPEPRCFAAATFDAAGHLWVVGGGDGMTRGASCLRSVVTIDPNAERPVWRPFGGGQLLRKRCGLALAADARQHTLYLCGGYSGGITYQDTVEVLDMSGVAPAHLLPPMRHARSGCGAGVGPDGALYVVGGSNNGSQMLPSCERYDPREGKWHSLAELPTPRGYLGAAFGPDGCLYAAGGCDSGWASPVAAFETLDVRAGQWRVLPPMQHARSNHAIVCAWPA